jgi:hypothetical protein
MPLNTSAGIRIWPPPEIEAPLNLPPGDAFEPTSTEPTFDLAPAPHLLPVPWFEQEERNWCWAACIKMVMHFFKQTSVEQCEVAGLFIKDDCCGDPDSFDFGCDPEDIERIFAEPRLGVSCSHQSDTVSFSRLQAEIDDGRRPIGVALFWFTPSGKKRGGHVIIVCGWNISDGRRCLNVNDPWYGQGNVPFSNLKFYYGPDDDGLDGVWRHTWVDIRKT